MICQNAAILARVSTLGIVKNHSTDGDVKKLVSSQFLKIDNLETPTSTLFPNQLGVSAKIGLKYM
jgi:hypothetical protein